MSVEWSPPAGWRQHDGLSVRYLHACDIVPLGVGGFSKNICASLCPDANETGPSECKLAIHEGLQASWKRKLLIFFPVLVFKHLFLELFFFAFTGVGVGAMAWLVCVVYGSSTACYLLRVCVWLFLDQMETHGSFWCVMTNHLYYWVYFRIKETVGYILYSETSIHRNMWLFLWHHVVIWFKCELSFFICMIIHTVQGTSIINKFVMN